MTITNDPNEKCENCKHFANDRGQTQCRKDAPRRGDVGKPWANVQPIDWCSEFKKKTEKPNRKFIDMANKSAKKIKRPRLNL